MNFLNEVAAPLPGRDLLRGRPAVRGVLRPADLHALPGRLRRPPATTRGLRRGRGPRGRCSSTAGPRASSTTWSPATLAVDEDIDVDPEAIVVTVGCQEAMVLVLRALLRRPGRRAAGRSPVLRRDHRRGPAARPAGGAGAGGAGRVDPADLVAAVARGLRAAGLRPAGLLRGAGLRQPVRGSAWTWPTRRRLLDVAAEQDLLILEDNPYGLFARDDARPRPTLKALDTDRRVVYLGSFAKTCLPGARVGYVRGRPDRGGCRTARRTLLADELAKIKSMVTVNTSPIAQAVIGGMLLEHGCSLRAGERGDEPGLPAQPATTCWTALAGGSRPAAAGPWNAPGRRVLRRRHRAVRRPTTSCWSGRPASTACSGRR